MKNRPKKLRGASRMRQKGLKLIQIWIDRDQHDVLCKYASQLGLSKTEFCRRAFNEACLEMFQIR
jgi:uncharacterized Zn ribbon protein